MEVLNYIGMAIIGLLVAILLYKLVRSVRLVPTQSAYIVERLGKYSRTLGAGFHLLTPFLEKVVEIISLKEETIDVPPQEAFTLDNVKVEVDGVLYISVIDPVNACYGITNYRFASTQLAQTTTRSIIGLLELDRTFEERDLISAKVVEVLTEVGNAWGLKVHRYEVQNIIPPHSVKKAMERQMTAERERRAIIAQSQGDKQSRINRSEGLKSEMINVSEGEKQRRINEAEGRAAEIEAIATATAQSIEKLAEAINTNGGQDAVRLRLSQDYINKLANIANPKTKVLVPADITKVDDLLASIGLDDGK